MHTEAEAKTKWCPHTRMAQHEYAQDGKGRFWEGGYSYNRTADNDKLYMPTGSKCIGSACMMWRVAPEQWETLETDLGQMPATDGWMQLSERGPNQGLMWRRRIADAGGYCGLAGSPTP